MRAYFLHFLIGAILTIFSNPLSSQSNQRSQQSPERNITRNTQRLEQMRRSFDQWFQLYERHSGEFARMVQRRPEVETIIFSEIPLHRVHLDTHSKQLNDYNQNFVIHSTPDLKFRDRVRTEIIQYYVDLHRVIRHDSTFIQMILENQQNNYKDIDWLLRFRKKTITDREIIARLMRQKDGLDQLDAYLSQELIPSLVLEEDSTIKRNLR